MGGYFGFLVFYAGPFIAAGLLFLLWAWSSHKLQYRYPGYYNWCLRVYDNLPKIAGVIIIVLVIYLYFTTPSMYNE